MMSRSLRADTRSRTKDDLKRAMQAVDKVRKWEKKWVTIGESSMKVFKWVPVNFLERTTTYTTSSNKENVSQGKVQSMINHSFMTNEDSVYSESSQDGISNSNGASLDDTSTNSAFVGENSSDAQFPDSATNKRDTDGSGAKRSKL